MRFNAPFWYACQLVALLLVAVEVTSKSATGSRALVVLDAELPRHHFSQFFGSLEKDLDLQLTFRQPKDEKPALTEYGENNFDHLLLLAPSAKSLSADLSPQALVSYLKAGGNILFGLSPHLAESYRDLAREFSIEFEPRGSRVVDHFSSLRGAENDTSLLLDSASTAAVADIASIFSSARPGVLQVPNAIAHRLGSNPLAFPLIRPATTSYSRDPSADASGAVLAGSAEDAAIVSAFQLRESSSRAVWSGSVDIFSDASWKDGSRRSSRDGTIDTKQTINKEVALSIMSWVTQTTGVVKVAGTSHSRVRSGPEDLREDYEETIGEDGKEVQRMYRVKDHVTFNIDLVEYRSGQGWSPASKHLDLQVSLVMLDPFITTTLRALDAPVSIAPSSKLAYLSKSQQTTTPASTRYTATFQLPDRHGVFTFKVDWARHGWSYIATRDTAPVRPFNSDEHPRGLSAAWPYVTGGFSTLAAFTLFVILWVTSVEKAGSRKSRSGSKEE
ncbi:Dolichyl-diphosphooligosaccharide-protein glycosyltransferase 48kDa subunit [Ceraceosorus guamensis]|uniref:Dolichyl-diphosphooligosaccharide--protein glycosyltransferase subunit WBP1 n=1 Tax=Ceraceosorus guamensis TaxID=1522189 RepID=A0A316WDB3_9BASI|nr:Dolichyl-diphosphooligosaccharide-protein glycosyltransferase 48kDa subunit [Ceraceosorus guamensis]PWN45843.1 Dolichyl-diphosphooligosaccharide-protein glycosyltransferase 48kDa subunit [Ceraceosorus guamensis]